MEQQVVTVIGGTGFVGRYVVKLLAEAGYTIRVISRHPANALHLKTAGNVGQIVLMSGNLAEPESLIGKLDYSYAVINLVGILFEAGRQSFTNVHAQGAEKVAQMAQAAGVQRFIHMSALGIEKAAGSQYARSKMLGEKAVLAAFPEATILRPSVIFGPEDNFFNQFAQMASFSPVLPLIGGGRTKFQPVYVGDVARAVLNCLRRPDSAGRTYELGGPHVYSFREILEYVMRVIGKKRMLLSIPSGMATIVGAGGEILPRPPLTRDQVRLLKYDNIVGQNVQTLASLGITPTAAEIIVPEYLARFNKKSDIGGLMLKFTDTPQHYPETKTPEARRRDFDEIYAPFNPAEAAVQAARCSQCGIPFCQIHCPLQNNIPDWLKLTAEGRLEEAYAISSATNTFPEICGRICPQDKLCEGNCVIEKGFKSVTIGSVEKYITETAFLNGWVKPISAPRETGFSVGIIGAGPGGLAAADCLRRRGHEVHVYDRYDRAGGLMMYGIPNFKLEKHVVLRRHHLLKEGGIQFHLNFEVGNNFEELREKHDSVLIATGVYKSREIEVPDFSLDNIVPAMTYLTASNRKGLSDKVPEFDNGNLNAEGKEIVVIGGGDTAMDCVRTAVRQGAKKVTCLYRRDRANMPGSAREVKNAEEEGVQFMWLSAPKAFIGKHAVNQILVQRMRLTTHDKSGRQSVAPVEGESFTLPCDMAIKALGFDAEDLPTMFGVPELKLSQYGTLAIDRRSYETSLPGVFAAGDIVRGASLVVWAIKDGREAAEAMHQHMTAVARKVA